MSREVYRSPDGSISVTEFCGPVRDDTSERRMYQITTNHGGGTFVQLTAAELAHVTVYAITAERES